MSETKTPEVGTVGWIDLTCSDADSVRGFYSEVVGWASSEVEMDGYSDYCMNTPVTGRPMTGVCHAQGVNEGIPAQWLIYVTVEDLDASIAKVREHGGGIVRETRDLGAQGRYCVIRDPAGAVCALFQPAAG